MSGKVKAVRVALDAEAERPGEFEWCDSARGENTYIVMCCSCGCGRQRSLPVYREGEPKPETPAWQWDGNLDEPTLTPSIQDLGGCEWHGFLTKGEFVTC